MALRWSFARPDLAEALEQAVEKTLAQGKRTRDLVPDDKTPFLTTPEMTNAIIDNLK